MTTTETSLTAFAHWFPLVPRPRPGSPSASSPSRPQRNEPDRTTAISPQPPPF